MTGTRNNARADVRHKLRTQSVMTKEELGIRCHPSEQRPVYDSRAYCEPIYV
jgi:hypothetical protein